MGTPHPNAGPARKLLGRTAVLSGATATGLLL